jgi:hypothetical protein
MSHAVTSQASVTNRSTRDIVTQCDRPSVTNKMINEQRIQDACDYMTPFSPLGRAAVECEMGLYLYPPWVGQHKELCVPFGPNTKVLLPRTTSSAM